jgi:hypothetical protein
VKWNGDHWSPQSTGFSGAFNSVWAAKAGTSGARASPRSGRGSPESSTASPPCSAWAAGPTSSSGWWATRAR